MPAHTMDHATLAQLVATRAVREARAVGRADGWGVLISVGQTEHTLTASRGAERLFRKFESLAAYLKSLGISSFQVDAAGFDPQATTAKRARPDAAERLRGAFEAQAHTNWVKEKVGQSLSDSRPNVPHSEVLRDVRAVINSKRARHASTTSG
jgi:hypothetical protein